MKNRKIIDRIIKNAFQEDIGSGDITTIATISKSIKSNGRLIAKEDGIVAGLEIVRRIFDLYDKKLKFKTFFQNGDAVKKGDIIAIVSGSVASILTSERTALNFLQRMSGIATYANKFSEAVKHTKAKVIDTRKTVPGFRILDKLAVTYGGCQNHRIGLYDMFLIKDNHIVAAGSILKAVRSCKQLMKKKKKKYKIEVETENLEQVMEALRARTDFIMLDNFQIDKMAEAVKLINCKAKIEASGGVTLESVKQIAETGVDYISVGALTHSVKALDISLELENKIKNSSLRSV